MPVKVDHSGRRFVEVEVEVPGSPEEAWRAIATGVGISSWFVPTHFEQNADEGPVSVVSNFGPGMESVAMVTDWDPPRSFAAETQDLGPNAPTVTTRWFVERRGDRACVVRVMHSVVTRSNDWDAQIEGWESGWPNFFRLLRLYLAHFSGQTCSAMQFTDFAPPPRDVAWQALLDGLGLGTPATGMRVQSSEVAPSTAGTVELVGMERAGQDDYPEELLLRLDEPAPGFAHLFAMDMGEQVLLAIRLHFFGDTAEQVRAREETVWQAWLAKRFPGEHQGGPGLTSD